MASRSVYGAAAFAMQASDAANSDAVLRLFFLGPTCSGDVERTLMKEQCVVLRVAVSEPVSSAGRFLTDTESSEARKEHRSWRERDGGKELAPIEIIKSRRAV